MKRMHFLSLLMMITVYAIASLAVDQSFVLPKISEIGHSFFTIVCAENFCVIILTTIVRFVSGVVLSFSLALILATTAFYHSKFKAFMEPIYLLLKTIPNITYIIIALIWLGRNGSVILVSFLVIFPILYHSILSAYENIDHDLMQITEMYADHRLMKLTKIYLPLIKKDVIIALQNSLSLAFKVSVMAEILGQVNVGIGKAMYFAKINYLMSDILAWTIIIIIISALIDYLFKLIIKIEE